MYAVEKSLLLLARQFLDAGLFLEGLRSGSKSGLVNQSDRAPAARITRAPRYLAVVLRDPTCDMDGNACI